VCESSAFDGVALSPGVIDRLGVGGVRVKQCRWRYGDAVRVPFPPHKALAGKFTTITGHAGGGFDGFSGYSPGDHKGCLCSLVPVFCAARGAPLTAALAVSEVDECGPPTLANMTPEFTKAEIDELLRIGDFRSGQGSGGDEVLNLLYRRQGFDAKPTVLSHDDYLTHLDAHQDAPRMLRALETSDQAQAYIDGRYFAGRGVYGNGTYTAFGDDAGALVQRFAGDSGDNVLRITLESDAKVVTHREMQDMRIAYGERLDARTKIASLREEWAADPIPDTGAERRLQTDFFQRRIDRAQAAMDEADARLDDLAGEWQDPIPDGLDSDTMRQLSWRFQDEGRVGTILNIDAYVVPGVDEIVVLNRGATIVSNRRYTVIDNAVG
jgi:hypothetical protein